MYFCCFSFSNSSNDSEMIPFDHRLWEIVEVKLENEILQKELDEIKVAFTNRKKWFEDRIKATKFALEKSELQRMQEKRASIKMQKELEQKLKSALMSVDVEQKNCRDLQSQLELPMKNHGQLKDLKKQTAQLNNLFSSIIEGVGSAMEKKLEVTNR